MTISVIVNVLQVRIQVDNLPVNEFDCVFSTTGATSVSSQAMLGTSNTVTCTLDDVPDELFIDTGMDCVMYLQYLCVLCDHKEYIMLSSSYNVLY